MGISNSGLQFQNLINQANRYYEEKGSAIITEIPTPVKVFRLICGRIKDGVFNRKSTVDYVGVTNARFIAFDCKSTLERTSFPIQDKIHQHQIDYLQQVQNQGGIAFILLQWIKYDEVYYIPFDDLLVYWKNYLGDGRKSIPYSDMIHFDQVTPSKNREVKVDYLKVIGGLKSGS